MSPEYFARALSLREAKLFISGLNRRYHAAWEQARMVGYYAAAPHLRDFDADKMPRFGWEEDSGNQQSAETSLAELEALRAYALARDEKLLKTKVNGER